MFTHDNERFFGSISHIQLAALRNKSKNYRLLFSLVNKGKIFPAVSKFQLSSIYFSYLVRSVLFVRCL